PIININCGQLSALRNIGLISPASVPTTCTYRINVATLNVCQIRLEFRQFNLAKPVVNPYPICQDDTFRVGNITLCGVNNGQHIYVPISPRQGERQITITITTKDRQANPSFVTPSWNIAVHQLDCPLFFGRTSVLNNQTVENKTGIQRTARTFISDWLAPQGCLQYFVQPTGFVESFNLAEGVGPYIGNMNYAICFRRLRASTKVNFIPLIFRMGYAVTNATNTGYDNDCWSSVQSVGRSEDHLFIPNAVTNQSPPVRATRFCAQSLLSTIITSSPPGPFMISFNSDQVYEGPIKEEIGFRLQYEIL
ncbi:unnamed protein product, partial [Diamesa hyperborea]